MSGTTAQSKLSLPGVFLRLEGLAMLAAAVAAYAHQGFGWPLFALVLMAPDVVIAVYRVNRRVGAVAYNVIHSYILPLALAAVSSVIGFDLGLRLALIWLAHIGMDRAAGFGLKYFTSFKDTHLTRV